MIRDYAMLFIIKWIGLKASLSRLQSSTLSIHVFSYALFTWFVIALNTSCGKSTKESSKTSSKSNRQPMKTRRLSSLIGLAKSGIHSTSKLQIKEMDNADQKLENGVEQV